MSLHKLTAGDGYTYLTRQTAALDATERGYAGLAAYYEQRGESPRTDAQILASDDVVLLEAIARGDVTRPRPGASPLFTINGEVQLLRRLEREDLCTTPIAGLPVLLPRGRRILAIVRGELPAPLPD